MAGPLHVIEHPGGGILVDTGMIDSTSELDEPWRPTIYPERIPRDVALVVNTHLHVDHCGGNRLFAGLPIYGAAARARGGTGARVHDPEVGRVRGASYVELDGEAEIAPGVRVAHETEPRDA